MNRNLIGRSSSTRLLSPLALIVVTGIGLSVASAQTSSQSPTLRPANSATATSGSGEYYFEFRSRQSWDYGHTRFIAFVRPDDRRGPAQWPPDRMLCRLMAKNLPINATRRRRDSLDRMLRRLMAKNTAINATRRRRDSPD
jgi:hypothetical protein